MPGKSLVSSYEQLLKDSKTAKSLLSSLWDERHISHSNIETDFTIEAYLNPINGHIENRLVEKTQRVTYYTHDYRYNNQAGEEASEALARMRQSLAKTQTTSAPDAAPPWRKNAILLNNTRVVATLGLQLERDAAALDKASITARSRSYDTKSSSDDGPDEFQQAQKTLTTLSSLEATLASMMDGISYTGEAAPQLEQAINKFIASELGSQAKRSSQVSSEKILHDAEKLYFANFRGEHRPGFRGWMVALAGLTGLLGGGLLGICAERLGGKVYPPHVS